MTLKSKKPSKFSKENAFQFEWENVKAFSYTSNSHLKSASAISFELNNTNHGKIKSTVSDRIYYVIEGKGEFVINNEVIPVSRSDVIIVPKNTPYDYRGTLKVFLVHIPAWDLKGEILLEKKKGRNSP